MECIGGARNIKLNHNEYLANDLTNPAGFDAIVSHVTFTTIANVPP